MEGVAQTRKVWTAVVFLLFAACRGPSAATLPPVPETTITSPTTAVVSTTATSSATEGEAHATREELLAPVEAVRSSLSGDWQEVGFDTIEVDPADEEGRVFCEEGAVGWSINTGTSSPLEAHGEWTRQDPVADNDIVYSVRSQVAQTRYAFATRVVVSVSAFTTIESAASVVELVRTGITETCGPRDVMAGLGGVPTRHNGRARSLMVQ
jgi:hypothetical protein